MVHIFQHNPGGMDKGSLRRMGLDPRKLEGEIVDASRPDLVPADGVPNIEAEPPRRGESMEHGRVAGWSNLGIPPEDHGLELPSQGAKGSMYRGSEWCTPGMVPDSKADQTAVPPRSVIETFKRAEGA